MGLRRDSVEEFNSFRTMPRPSFAQTLRHTVSLNLGSDSLLRSVVAVSAVMAGSGCSFIYNLDADQCQVNSDCKQVLGSKYAKYVCEQGVCVPPEPEPIDTTEDDAGVDAGPVGCTSNAQCIEENLDQPHICRDGECIALMSDECPVVLQAENLKVPEPIIIGAYSSIDPLNKLASQVTLSFDLALSEFTEEVGGLAGGPNNTRRKFVSVVCQGPGSTPEQLESSLSHLIDTVGTRGIIATLFSDDLRDAFDSRGKTDNIFFMSPLGADSSLTGQDNAGLLWFMMGPDSDLAPDFVALTKRAEAFQRTKAGLDEADKVRVALVQGSLAPARDVAQVLLSDPDHSLVFNGEKTLSNDEADFLLVELTSDFETDDGEVSTVISSLGDFKPHIIVVTAGSEFTKKVLRPLESNWDDDPDTGQVRPFYVTGPLLAFDQTFRTLEDGQDPPSQSRVRTRLAGVNFTGDPDQTLFNMFKVNFQAAYPDIEFLSTENFYDAAYYLMYAIAASGNPAQLTGDSIAEGMLRIVSKSATEMPVGPNSISDILSTLAVPTSRIALRGAMGPADFNLGTGARIALGSVYCVAPDGFHYDTLRRDADTDELEGVFPCFGGL